MDVMPRNLSKPRPKQGAHLVQLRRDAGLSQKELADTLGVPQQNIAFWEASEKPPRSEVLPLMARALGVDLKDLIASEAMLVKSKPRPQLVGKVRDVFEEVALLPRRQQEKVAEFVSAFVLQYNQKRMRK